MVFDNYLAMTISIHSAIASGDMTSADVNDATVQFQSTPPSLAETAHTAADLTYQRISIHSAIASGDVEVVSPNQEDGISIHSAIASGD